MDLNGAMEPAAELPDADLRAAIREGCPVCGGALQKVPGYSRLYVCSRCSGV